MLDVSVRGCVRVRDRLHAMVGVRYGWVSIWITVRVRVGTRTRITIENVHVNLNTYTNTSR